MLSRVLLAQLNGELDPAFGINGVKLVDVGPQHDQALAIATGIDGKIILGGFVTNINSASTNRYGVVRLNSDGSLDQTFSQDGMLQTDFVWGNSQLRSISVYEDGKILASGSTNNPGGTEFRWTLVRYNSDGSQDVTFGNNGILHLSIGTSDAAFDHFVMENGQIIVVGSSSYAQNMAIARLNPNGTLDPTFGSSGVALFPSPIGGQASGYSLKITDDNHILIGGSVGTSNARQMAVWRTDLNGYADLDFGNNGFISHSWGQGVTNCLDLALDSSGSIYITGYYDDGDDQQMVIAKLNTFGSLVSDFGFMGRVLLNGGPGDDEGRAVLIPHNDLILVGGSYSDEAGILKHATVALESDGSVYSQWGFNGIHVTSSLPNSGGVYGLALDNNGFVYTGGRYFDGLYNEFCVTKYKSVMTNIEFNASESLLSVSNTGWGVFDIKSSNLIQSIGIYGVSGNKIQPETVEIRGNSALIDLGREGVGLYYIRVRDVHETYKSVKVFNPSW